MSWRGCLQVCWACDLGAGEAGQGTFSLPLHFSQGVTC